MNCTEYVGMVHSTYDDRLYLLPSVGLLNVSTYVLVHSRAINQDQVVRTQYVCTVGYCTLVNPVITYYAAALYRTVP